MDSSTKDNLSSLPDLPELEAITASSYMQKTYGSAAGVHALLFTGIATLVVGSGYGAHYFLIVDGKSVVLLPGLALLVMSIIILRWALMLATDDFYWETEPQGLRARGWLRDRHVEWSDVNSIFEKTSSFPPTLWYYIATRKGTFKIPGENDIPVIHLHISIWQHLRRARKDVDFDLSPVAITLWNPIPEDTPQEMEWVNLKPPKMAFHYAEIIGLIVIFGTAWFFTSRDVGFRNGYWDWIRVAAPLFPVCIGCLRSPLQTARRVILYRDRLEAILPRKRITLQLSDITMANWEDTKYLVIYGPRRNTIRIPRRKHDGSETLILAIIRGLRECKNSPILLPFPKLTDDSQED